VVLLSLYWDYETAMSSKVLNLFYPRAPYFMAGMYG